MSTVGGYYWLELLNMFSEFRDVVFEDVVLDNNRFYQNY